MRRRKWLGNDIFYQNNNNVVTGVFISSLIRKFLSVAL